MSENGILGVDDETPTGAVESDHQGPAETVPIEDGGADPDADADDAIPTGGPCW